MTGSNCDCLICRLEKSILTEVSDAGTREEYRLLTASNETLSVFPTALDLIHHLHAPDGPSNGSSPDRLLRELLKRNASAPRVLQWQRLLLLVFIPTIHRTASQTTAMFPSLGREDVSQQVVSHFLEFLESAELESRISHIAFTIARKLRRSTFRWAIHAVRGAMPEEAEGRLNANPDAIAAEEPLHAEMFLRQFLDSCEERGWLSIEERHLLVQFRIEGVSFLELGRRNRHSAVAIQHRVQRLLDRLRRLARRTGPRVPEQLELFPR